MSTDSLVKNAESLSKIAKARMQIAVANLATQRIDFIKRITGSDRDIDNELNYPSNFSALDYFTLFDRSDIAEKVVTVYPDDCWSVTPKVYENEEPSKTEFETVWDELEQKHNIFHYLYRADVLSGIGRFGVLLLGLDDGNDLMVPVPGLDDRGESTVSTKQLNLLFARPFPEHLVEVKELEKDVRNPRYGLPKYYQINLSPDGNTLTGENESFHTKLVHWTRVIHLADNRGSSEIYGKPRQKAVLNRLLDLKKVLGGSAEMFWRGAFPGYSFEVDPEFAAAAGLNNEEDIKEFKDSMEKEFQAYADGLKRYLASVGVTAKSLAPQVANPEKHVFVQLKIISTVIGVPFRIFMGSEMGSLASSQDTRNWNKKLKRRQNHYLTPMVIRPFVNRMMDIGVLPRIDNPIIEWPDLDTMTEQDKADLADKITTALQKYVSGKVEKLMPVDAYLGDILGLSPEKVQSIIDTLKESKEEDSRITIDPMPEAERFGRQNMTGGADNVPDPDSNGKEPKPQNPKDFTSDRTRASSGASRTTD